MSTIKKMLLVVAACVVCFALVACKEENNTTNNTTTPTKGETAATPTPDAGTNVTPTPTEVLRDLKNLEVIVGDWWSGDDWKLPDTTAVEEANKEYQEAMMDKYHYTIKRKGICGWNDQGETCLNSIMANEPLADIMTFDYRFIAAFMAQDDPLFIDVAKLGEFDFSDEKWNQVCVDAMTLGGKTFGWGVGVEPRTGIFYNKDLVSQFLGADKADYPYELQASNEWTWDNFKKLAKDLTKDTNNDGQIDVYGITMQQSVFFEMAIVSNGHAMVQKDGNKYVSTLNSSEVIDDCNWAYSFWTENLTRRALEGEPWNYFEKMWTKQQSVMIPYDEYKAGEFNGDEKDADGNVIGKLCDFVYGFVCFPMGPNAKATGKGYIPVSRENIMVMPNCAAETAKAKDVAFAYNIFTNKAPDVAEDKNAWKGSYESLFRDSKAVNETLDIMINKATPYQNPTYMVPGLWDNDNGIIQSRLLYNIDAEGQTPASLIESLNAEYQTALDSFAEKILK